MTIVREYTTLFAFERIESLITFPLVARSMVSDRLKINVETTFSPITKLRIQQFWCERALSRWFSLSSKRKLWKIVQNRQQQCPDRKFIVPSYFCVSRCWEIQNRFFDSRNITSAEIYLDKQVDRYLFLTALFTSKNTLRIIPYLTGMNHDATDIISG